MDGSESFLTNVDKKGHLISLESLQTYQVVKGRCIHFWNGGGVYDIVNDLPVSWFLDFCSLESLEGYLGGVYDLLKTFHTFFNTTHYLEPSWRGALVTMCWQWTFFGVTFSREHLKAMDGRI